MREENTARASYRTFIKWSFIVWTAICLIGLIMDIGKIFDLLDGARGSGKPIMYSLIMWMEMWFYPIVGTIMLEYYVRTCRKAP